MNSIISAYFLCLSIGMVLVLLFAIFRFIYREKYAESFLKLPDESRERLIKSDRLLVKVFKIFLWLSPFYLVFVPFALFLYLRQFFLATLITVLLLFIVVLQEYLFRNWLIKYVEIKATSNPNLVSEE
jgi:small-conductance mechanosensitive channel